MNNKELYAYIGDELNKRLPSAKLIQKTLENFKDTDDELRAIALRNWIHMELFVELTEDPKMFPKVQEKLDKLAAYEYGIDKALEKGDELNKKKEEIPLSDPYTEKFKKYANYTDGFFMAITYICSERNLKKIKNGNKDSRNSNKGTARQEA